MTRSKTLAFISALLFSIALDSAARTVGRIIGPELPRMLDVAAKGGEIRRAKLLIFLGADVNGKVYPQFVCGNATEEDLAMDYHSALQSAAFAGQNEAVELLLGNDADINAMDGFGRTALWYAALGGHPNGARLLLERGADPRIFIRQTSMSTSPLEEAAQAGETEIAGMMLEYGAGQHGELDSALWQAVWYDKSLTAKYLISRGANVSQVRHGMTLLDRAYEHKDAELIKHLKETKSN